MAFLGDVEYQPDVKGTAEAVKCLLVDDWITPVDCMKIRRSRNSIFPPGLR